MEILQDFAIVVGIFLIYIFGLWLTMVVLDALEREGRIH